MSDVDVVSLVNLVVADICRGNERLLKKKFHTHAKFRTTAAAVAEFKYKINFNYYLL